MSSFSKRGGAQPAAVRTSVTCSRSAKANIPGAFGTGFGRGGRCLATAVIGTSIHGFSASVRQHTIAMRASGVAAPRILAKAATLSPKNIVPKAEVSKSYSSSAAVAGSACRQSTLARPAALAPLTLSQHRPGNVEPHHAAGRTDGARKLQRGRAAAAADIHHPLAGARCSKAEQGVRHRCERDVGVLLPSHPGVAALAVPEGEHVGVNLFGGGHACPPVERVCTLQLCRAGCKRRRTDVISTGIPRIIRRSDAEARCPLWVKSRHRGISNQCPLYPQ